MITLTVLIIQNTPADIKEALTNITRNLIDREYVKVGTIIMACFDMCTGISCTHVHIAFNSSIFLGK